MNANTLVGKRGIGQGLLVVPAIRVTRRAPNGQMAVHSRPVGRSGFPILIAIAVPT